MVVRIQLIIVLLAANYFSTQTKPKSNPFGSTVCVCVYGVWRTTTTTTRKTYQKRINKQATTRKHYTTSRGNIVYIYLTLFWCVDPQLGISSHWPHAIHVYTDPHLMKPYNYNRKYNQPCIIILLKVNLLQYHRIAFTLRTIQIAGVCACAHKCAHSNWTYNRLCGHINNNNNNNNKPQ